MQPSKNQKLDEESFVAFDHAAAGHEGVRCDESGSLIAKPCTQKEILFYESGANHPAFQKYMPTFIGSLRAGAPKEALDLSTANAETPLVIASAETSTDNSSLPLELATETDSIAITRPAKKPDEPWVPSGGKKLDTGLSIVLENITDGFVRPSVLDVKLGARLWDDDAVPDKREKLDKVAAETTSGSLGFRIAGMKTWAGEGQDTKQPGPEVEVDVTASYLPSTASESIRSKSKIIESEGYRRFDKWYGRAFNENNVQGGFEAFLASAKAGKIDRSAFVAARVAAELRSMQAVLESEESRMYSASVLIVYEGDSEAFERALEVERKEAAEPEDLSTKTTGHGGDNDDEGEEEDEEEEEDLPKVYDIRLIDFAHASWTPGQGPDENLLRGLRNVAKIMEDLSQAAN